MKSSTLTNGLLFIVIIIVILYLIGYIPTYVKSEIDNNYYLVSNTSDKQEVADTLARLNVNVDTLLNYLNAVYSKEPDNRYLKYNSNVQLLLSRFNKNLIGENFLKLGTSFTLNKGTFVALCVKNNKEIHDTNTLMYVLLHELAHVGSESNGHTQEFAKFFKFLVGTAIKLDLYRYIDYNSAPVNYCGMDLNVSI
jgi:hypothetical protein